jgi:hypothetical protein
MRVDRSWVVRTAHWVGWLGRSQQGLDGLVSENDERSHRPEIGAKRLVAAGVADAANDLFATEFLEVVSGMPGTVLEWSLLAQCAHSGGEIGAAMKH